jgi:hypothetical protein
LVKKKYATSLLVLRNIMKVAQNRIGKAYFFCITRLGEAYFFFLSFYKIRFGKAYFFFFLFCRTRLGLEFLDKKKG